MEKGGTHKCRDKGVKASNAPQGTYPQGMDMQNMATSLTKIWGPRGLLFYPMQSQVIFLSPSKKLALTDVKAMVRPRSRQIAQAFLEKSAALYIAM